MPQAVLTPLSHLFDSQAIITRRELKSLMKRSNRPGLVHLACWCLLVATTSTLVIWSTQFGLWMIAAMFVHGIVMVHHFALQHECSHYTAFRSRWLCNALAGICGFLLIIPPKFFRYEHCDHHTYTNIKGKDPEMIELPDSLYAYVWYLSAIPYWKSQVSGLFRRAVGTITREESRFIPKSEQRAVILESRVMLLAYVLIAAVGLMQGWVYLLWLWVIPMLLAEPVMRYIRMTEHVGRPMVKDRKVNTRTNIVSRFWRFIAWNMNFHAEHHFASSVPFHALEKLHIKLQGHLFVESNGYTSAHRDIVNQIQQREA